MTDEKICGVVTLYNPTESHLLNIKTYVDGLGCLYVVDNSPMDDQLRIKSIGVGFDKVKVLSSGKNLGISGALNLAINQARKDGYEWLLTMDQDSFFEPEQFRRFMGSFVDMPRINTAIISPVQDVSDYVCSEDVQYEEVDIVVTSGNLLNLQSIDVIGVFDESLFIDSVDHDFCLRANSCGYKVLQLNNCYLCHKIGEPYAGSLLWGLKKRNIHIHSPKRMYFMVRNSLFIRKEYGDRFPEFMGEHMKGVWTKITKTLKYGDRRAVYVRYIAAGIIDYVFKRYGNRVSI